MADYSATPLQGGVTLSPDQLNQLFAMSGGGAGGGGTQQGFDWGSFLQSIAGAGMGLGLLGRTEGQTQQAAAAADPFAQYRPQFAQQLISLMKDPSQAIKDTPGYEFGLGQGLEAINRGAGASGLLNSGNRLLALQQYGTDYATKAFGDDFNRLARLAGVDIGSPAAAGQLLSQGQTAGNQQLTGGVGSLIRALFGSGTSGAGGAIQLLQRAFGGGLGGTDISGGGADLGGFGGTTGATDFTGGFTDTSGFDLGGLGGTTGATDLGIPIEDILAGL